MTEPAQLQISDLEHLSRDSLTCTVRCLSGTVRVGDAVWLAPAGGRPVGEPLTITGISYYADLPMDFVDAGHTARVTASGRIDVPAVRAATAAQGAPAVASRAGPRPWSDLRLTVC